MITAVVGGQFGSEGKGAVVGHIAPEHQVHVRVGAANAGHTVYTERGYVEKHVMQQLPCAAYANPDAELVLGPGAMISLEILLVEVALNQAWRRKHALAPMKLVIDYRAHVVTPEQIDLEQRSGLAERIGSTSALAREGIGTAAAARVMREATCMTAKQTSELQGWLTDTVNYLRQSWVDKAILLEGTQGTGLSNTTGFFPYVTSRNTTVAGLAADAGVPPTKVDSVILVCRTYPIRVAGNSGPFWTDSDEISWHDLKIDPESERTTVTKKVRRVATFSYDQLREAVWLNGATEIALMFADYEQPGIAGVEGQWQSGGGILERGYPQISAMMEQIESETGRPVRYIGTGPRTMLERI